MEDRQWFILYVLICLEVGIFLVFVPWSAIWERNYFLENYPGLRPLLLSPAFRGAVCGLGFGNIYLAVHEIFGRLRRSASSPPTPETNRTHPPAPSDTDKVLTASEDP